MAGREKASERHRKQELLCWIRVITLFFRPVGFYTARPLSGLYRKFWKWPRQWQGKSTCFTRVLHLTEDMILPFPGKQHCIFVTLPNWGTKFWHETSWKGQICSLKRLFPVEIWRLSTHLISKLQCFTPPPTRNHRFFRNSFYQIEGFVDYASTRRSPQVSFILKKDCLVALIFKCSDGHEMISLPLQHK